MLNLLMISYTFSYNHYRSPTLSFPNPNKGLKHRKARGCKLIASSIFPINHAKVMLFNMTYHMLSERIEKTSCKLRRPEEMKFGANPSLFI
ncbi:unnamed protein product [Lactuca virosa]|uniref:Uncharacterized protein n=1 Tax=Lactuca virosa TaxID=75947 RepID=A0AAU9MX34_9ASTR|nr:unnamed protein product [Lactuca virosa]